MLKSLSIFTFILSAFLIASCANNNKAKDNKDNYDFIVLTEAQVSNFTLVLPDILDFANKYSAGLSQEEKESFDYYKKFFSAIKLSSKMKASANQSDFSSVDDLIIVYKNVTLAYDTIKNEFTNYQLDMKTLEDKIKRYRAGYQAILSTNDGTYSKKDLEEMALGLTNNEIRYQNILLVKKFESSIDKIVKSFEK
jgi:hypothetical protein